MFKIGDRAVYPAQGVGVVENIESREFCGQTHDFYILRIIDNDMTIMVPVGNAHQVGLRTLISKDKVETIYNVLEEKQIGSLAIASWSRRQREYNDKIKTGDPVDVAEVLRELYLIKEENGAGPKAAGQGAGSCRRDRGRYGNGTPRKYGQLILEGMNQEFRVGC
jgi:CarD family transcriptional regulator